MLALNVLIENADCVLPVDNQALFDIVARVDQQYQKKEEVKSRDTGGNQIGASVFDISG